MTKQELEAKLANAEYALKEAAGAFEAINQLITKIDYHPDAPVEVGAAYTIGAIRATVWRGSAAATRPI